MATVMEKSRRADPDALRSLYHANKAEILFLCDALLLDEAASRSAALQVFKNSWEAVLEGRVGSESEFESLLLYKTINLCKNRVLKRDPKAFRLPPNKNFMNTVYQPEKMALIGEPADVILKNLPDLHRFIYILRLSTKLGDKEIGRLLSTNAETVKNAASAEEENIRRICAAVSKGNGSECFMSLADFHESVLKKRSDFFIPKETEALALMAIDSACEPIRSKRRKKAAAVFAVCVCVIMIASVAAGLAIMNFVQTSDEEAVSSAADAVSSAAETVNDTAASALSSDPQVSEASSGSEESPAVAVVENPSYYADIAIENYGTITVALDGTSAPETVDNFVSLAESGFYNGLTFHRIMEGFMMQGGDPNGDGTGGSDSTIHGEFTDNGFENNLSNTRGAIAMARSEDYDSASSQFFIVQEDSTHLDGQYAVFGYVTQGMDVVDAVCEAAQPTDDNGTIPAEEQPVITSITVRPVGDDTASASSDAA